MAERDDKNKRPETGRFSRRLFLAGGAAVTGGVIWGATDAASSGATPLWEHHKPPTIPGGTGNTGHTGSHAPPTRLEITTTSLPFGVIGHSYSGVVGARNGVRPLRWTITRGGLPGGLVLNPSTGAITGTVQRGGLEVYIFTVTVTDSTHQSASQVFSIVIT